MKMYKKVGSKGSISLHYRGVMCSIFPLTNKKNEDYYIEVFARRRLNKQKVASDDHIHFCKALMGLIKLKKLENDIHNGWICLKKPKKRITS